MFRGSSNLHLCNWSRMLALLLMSLVGSSLTAHADYDAPRFFPIPSPLPSTSPTPLPPNRSVDQSSIEEKAKALALWNQALEKFSARDYHSSAKLLKDYVDRYPASPEALDARSFLAQSLLFSKNPKAAIPVFISVVESRGNTPFGNEARIYLGQSYLDASKFTEAFLVSEEILKQSDLPITMRAKALLLRAHAQAGMKQNTEAEKTLVAFQTIADDDPELERETAGSFLISLLLKGNHCDALPSGKSLPEDQVLDQVARKGICVLEMGTLLSKASKKLDETELTAATDTFLTSLRDYRKNCAHPPLALGKRAKSKWTAAQGELSERLREGCDSVGKLVLETFRDRQNLKKTMAKIQAEPL